ncbi:MAG: delta-60 repeat domain-containing protein, partial [Chthoniobacterales bacterium]
CFASALVLQADGKIIAAGTKYVRFSSDQSSDTDFALARYNSDGSLDSTFGVGGEVATDFHQGNDDALSVLLQPDGKIVATGDATSLPTVLDFAVVRYLPDGTIDLAFGNQGKVETDFGAANLDQARSAVLQSDGKIVAAGTTVTQGGLDQPFAVARYNPDGTRDLAFGKKGLATVDFGSFLQSARSILLQPDGKLIVVGFPDTESSDSDFLIARLNANGTLDSAFGTTGEVRTSFGNLNGGANAAVLQPDGKIVAAGFNATPTRRGVDVALARYLGN